jgi:hypothetical protein
MWMKIDPFKYQKDRYENLTPFLTAGGREHREKIDRLKKYPSAYSACG